METGNVTPEVSQKKDDERELSPDKKLGDDINQLQLDALTKGKFTDCVFLVGPDGNLEEVHAVKNTMMMASSFMVELFRSPICPAPGPIRIIGVDPKIFKLVVEFAHLGLLKTPVNCQDLPDLLIAADLYKIESLKILCAQMLERDLTASEVWLTLQKMLQSNDLKSEAKCCLPLLKNKTEECLEHPTFETTSSECVKFLLDQDFLNLKSEPQLIGYCVKWAHKQRDWKKSFRQVVGLLRLKTLTPEQVSYLPFNFFTQNELQALLKISLKLPTLNELPLLCSNETPRQFRSSLKRKRVHDSGKHHEFSMKLMPKGMFSKSYHELKKGEKIKTDATFINVLTITPKVDIYLTRYKFLGQIQEGSPIMYDEKVSGFVNKPRENNYKFKVSVSKDGEWEDIFSYTGEKTNYDTLVSFHLDEPEFLPKGETAKLVFKFDVDSPSIFRNILCEDVNSFIQNNHDAEVFEAIHLQSAKDIPIVVHEIKFTIANYNGSN